MCSKLQNTGTKLQPKFRWSNVANVLVSTSSTIGHSNCIVAHRWKQIYSRAYLLAVAKQLMCEYWVWIHVLDDSWV